MRLQNCLYKLEISYFVSQPEAPYTGPWL